MPYRYQMTKKNQHGDNGWWKKTGDTIAHYFVKKLPLCGTNKFNSPDIGVQPKNCYDRRCKMCSKVRRNRLRARYNNPPWLTGNDKTIYAPPVNKSPRRSQ